MKTVGVILLVCLFQAEADSNQNTPGNGTEGACTITNGSGENITIPGDVTITGDTNCIFDKTGTVSVGGDVTISDSDCTVSGQAIISVAGSVTITSSNITVIEGSVLCIHVGGDATASSVIFDTQNGSQTEVNIDGALTLTTTMCSGSTSTYDVNYGGFLTSTGSSTCVV